MGSRGTITASRLYPTLEEEMPLFEVYNALYKYTICGSFPILDVLLYVNAALISRDPLAPLEPCISHLQITFLTPYHTTRPASAHLCNLTSLQNPIFTLSPCSYTASSPLSLSIASCAGSQNSASLPAPECICPQTCNLGFTVQICCNKEGQPRPMSRCPAGGICVTSISQLGGIGVLSSFQGASS